MVYEHKGKNQYAYRTIEYSVPAQQVGEHLEELNEQHGEVTAQIMLDDARPEEALLHPLYEWNDGVAAEKYRLQQSRKILSELVVVHVYTPEIEVKEPVRAFVSVKDANEKASYKPIVHVMSEEDTRQKVFDNALRELAMFEAKYRGLVEFEKLISAYMANRE